MNFLQKNLKLLITIGVLFIGFLWINPIGTFNTMVDNDETTDSQWAQVENVYQRRMDLIPNLVATVKGYADHEKETLEGVIQARANATKTTIDPSNMSVEQIQAYMDNQQQLSSALSKLMVVVEKYPDLKANQGFLDLQASLEGSENRISEERKKFNDKAKEENSYLKKFPNNVLNSMYGFEPKPYFESQEGADTAPKVEF